MRLNRVVLGLALGIMTLGASANTVDAKAKPITVTVDKADSATARKVDAALRKGKGVTLKVRGSKKASKKLLIKLQDAVAKANVYGARFDLDNGNRSVQGKGNKFHTYADLRYKQSGKYGCYTLTKDSCEAYKYFLLRVERNYKSGSKGIPSFKEIIESNYKLVVNTASDSNDNFYEVSDYLYNAVDAEYHQAMEDIWKLGEGVEELCDVYARVITGETDDRYIQGAVADFMDKYPKYEGVVEIIAANLDGAEEQVKEAVVPPTKEEYIKGKYGKGVSDFYCGKKSYISGRSVDLIPLLIQYDMEWYKRFAGKIFYSDSDAYRMKELYKGTKGVCMDYAISTQLSLDYFGLVSYYVAHDEEDHAICVASGTEFNLSGSNLVAFNNVNEIASWDIMDKKAFKKNLLYFDIGGKDLGWERNIKRVMGSDYPF